MRKLMHMTLCVLLAAVTVQTAPCQPSTLATASGYGLDLARSYTGAEVAQMLQIADEEAQTAITRAYDEGYKAAALRYAPENAALSSVNRRLQGEADALRGAEKNRVASWLLPVWAVCGMAAGCVLGYSAAWYDGRRTAWRE